MNKQIQQKLFPRKFKNHKAIKNLKTNLHHEFAINKSTKIEISFLPNYTLMTNIK